MRYRFSIFTSPMILVAGLGFFLLSCNARSEIAPAWSLKDLDGKTVQLSDFKGKVVILNFWATWCPPCVAEIPDFITVQKEYGDKGVVVIGLSVDSVQPSEVAAFVKKAGINYPIVMCTDKIADAYKTEEGVPWTFFVAPDGKLAATHQGGVDKSYLEGYIQKLLPDASRH